MNQAYWKGRLTRTEKVFAEYRKQRAIAKRKFDKKHQSLMDTLDKDAVWLKENCPHIEVEKKRTNVEGGYLDKGYEDVWYECSYCHEKSVVKTTMGGYG
jgi:hypothetical protein